MRPKCKGVEAARLPAGVSACCWIDLEREKCALCSPNLLRDWKFPAKVVDSVMSTSSFPLVIFANAILLLGSKKATAEGTLAVRIPILFRTTDPTLA
jgi:hypothetical protein